MEERYDLLCVDAPRAEEIRDGLLGVEAARGAAERALSDPTRLMLGRYARRAPRYATIRAVAGEQEA
jgi:hypothetical protein